MSVVRGFVVDLPESETRDRVRSALLKLSGKNAINIIKETDGTIEFSGAYPGYALLELGFLSPGSSIRERMENGIEHLVSDELPEWIEGIITCPNKNCITIQPKEPTRPRFRIFTTSPPKVQCYYCGRYLPQDALISQIT